MRTSTGSRRPLHQLALLEVGDQGHVIASRHRQVRARRTGTTGWRLCTTNHALAPRNAAARITLLRLSSAMNDMQQLRCRASRLRLARCGACQKKGARQTFPAATPGSSVYRFTPAKSRSQLAAAREGQKRVDLSPSPCGQKRSFTDARIICVRKTRVLEQIVLERESHRMVRHSGLPASLPKTENIDPRGKTARCREDRKHSTGCFPVRSSQGSEDHSGRIAWCRGCR